MVENIIKYYQSIKSLRMRDQVKDQTTTICCRSSLFFKPSTVVIPSDNKGLMRELKKALAELRAGNTSMRNLVVPLAQEARRKRILPDGLLSPDEETWVYA